MAIKEGAVLALNGGSSSIKFAVYAAALESSWRIGGELEHTGSGDMVLRFSRPDVSGHESTMLRIEEDGSTIDVLLDWLEVTEDMSSMAGVGHRIVHGMGRTTPEVVTPLLLDSLRRAVPVDPEHLPSEIRLIDTIARRHPGLRQVCCFDSAFHANMPRVATLLPIPRRYDTAGVRRYGFHGLSYAFLMEELSRLAGSRAANGRVVLAHLGSGASLAAVRDGHGIDTSMGFTSSAGLPMATRSGDLDPGLAAYLARTEQLSAEDFYAMASHASGLVGISETSSDMRELLSRESSDNRAAEAIAVFCYQTKKWIGSFAAALGGVDTLVFSGGIGENASSVRQRICEGLGFLGIEIDAHRNDANEGVISTDASKATVRVIATNEQWMIAKSAFHVFHLGV